MASSTSAPVGGRIPLWVKVAYSAYVALLVPVYWASYGPTNFLYFCDIALLMTVPAVWLENPLLASAPLVGIFLPQLVWQVDFIVELTGHQLTTLTGYMFDESIHWFTRGLSFFHFWLPLFLLWAVWRLGYDRRAFVVWTVLSFVVMLVCYFWLPGPDPDPPNPNEPININYVYGFDTKEPQDWMPSGWYLALLMVVMPVAVYWPTHWLLKRFWPAAPDGKNPESP